MERRRFRRRACPRPWLCGWSAAACGSGRPRRPGGPWERFPGWWTALPLPLPLRARRARARAEGGRRPRSRRSSERRWRPWKPPPRLPLRWLPLPPPSLAAARWPRRCAAPARRPPRAPWTLRGMPLGGAAPKRTPARFRGRGRIGAAGWAAGCRLSPALWPRGPQRRRGASARCRRCSVALPGRLRRCMRRDRSPGLRPRWRRLRRPAPRPQASRPAGTAAAPQQAGRSWAPRPRPPPPRPSDPLRSFRCGWWRRGRGGQLTASGRQRCAQRRSPTSCRGWPRRPGHAGPSQEAQGGAGRAESGAGTFARERGRRTSGARRRLRRRSGWGRRLLWPWPRTPSESWQSSRRTPGGWRQRAWRGGAGLPRSRFDRPCARAGSGQRARRLRRDGARPCRWAAGRQSQRKSGRWEPSSTQPPRSPRRLAP
mmetsp:Transcript_23293/g.88296  ORF Transcript_23293/g.88296 Transcript_23293/m.88296 type:complete len:427 (+) Transcript_23293:1032-2312(+)